MRQAGRSGDGAAARGGGVVVAVLDAGCESAGCPSGRVLPGINLSGDGAEHDLSDPTGHGTAMCATILAEAPGAAVLPVRLLDRFGLLARYDGLEAGLQWVAARRADFGIAVVCVAIAADDNHDDDERFRWTEPCRLIAGLRREGVLTVAASGNRRLFHAPAGMAWPAVIRETVSVAAMEERGGRFVPCDYAQRLAPRPGAPCATTLFARPGPPDGGSGAAAVVAGRLAALRAAEPALGSEALLARLLAGCASVQDGEDARWPALAPARDGIRPAPHPRRTAP